MVQSKELAGFNLKNELWILAPSILELLTKYKSLPSIYTKLPKPSIDAEVYSDEDEEEEEGDEFGGDEDEFGEEEAEEREEVEEPPAKTKSPQKFTYRVYASDDSYDSLKEAVLDGLGIPIAMKKWSWKELPPDIRELIIREPIG